MYCKNCGTKLTEDAAFCTVCGAQVEGASPLPADPAVLPQNTYPMKWHKFLIYFQLFVAAILNLFNGVQYFAGLFSDPDGFGTWSAIYIFYGVVSVVLAVLAIYVRFRLAGFRKNGPKMYILFLCITCVLGVLNLISVMGSEIYLVSSAVSSLFTNALMLVLTNIYYKKRADLFIN